MLVTCSFIFKCFILQHCNFYLFSMMNYVFLAYYLSLNYSLPRYFWTFSRSLTWEYRLISFFGTTSSRDILRKLSLLWDLIDKLLLSKPSPSHGVCGILNCGSISIQTDCYTTLDIVVEYFLLLTFMVPTLSRYFLFHAKNIIIIFINDTVHFCITVDTLIILNFKLSECYTVACRTSVYSKNARLLQAIFTGFSKTLPSEYSRIIKTIETS